MNAGEKRLLSVFLLVLAAAATALHLVVRFDTPAEVQTETEEAHPAVPPWDESAVLALGARALTVEPAEPAGSWRFVWKGKPAVLLDQWVAAEAGAGGAFVTFAALREASAGDWTLELVLSPWFESLTPAPAGTTDAGPLSAALGWAVRPRAAPLPSPPPAPAPETVVLPAADLVLLGSYGDGAGRHWWLKERTTDRVFEVPGAPDWILVQAGSALILNKAGVLYRLELNP